MPEDSSQSVDDISFAVRSLTVTASDGYALNVQEWIPTGTERATLLLLHGVVSHSGWLEPIARRLAAGGVRVICPDRRGSGRNGAVRGDAPDGPALLDDVARVIAATAGDSALHLAGFCWGAVYAVNYLSAISSDFASVVLLAPSIFPAASLRDAVFRTGSSGDATEPPIVPLDGFTSGPDYEGFIIPDPDRLRCVSPRFNGIMQRFSQMVAVRLQRSTLPLLVVLADDDRMTDNDATERAFPRFRADPKRIVRVPGQHGVQFDAPDATSDAVLGWLRERGG